MGLYCFPYEAGEQTAAGGSGQDIERGRADDCPDSDISLGDERAHNIDEQFGRRSSDGHDRRSGHIGTHMQN